MKKSSFLFIFILSVIVLITLFPITASAEVSADQYEFSNGVLHLK